jgi:hypothetical protein
MAERSLSSGLLSRHAERSAAPAFAKALPDGSPDAPVPAAEAPDLPRADAYPSATAVSGASDAAPQASQPDAADHLALAGAAVEKSAVPALDAREPDATFPPQEPQLAPWAQPAEVAELYKPVAVQSAARSCAATESAAQPAQADAARILAPAQKLEWKPAVKQQTQKLEARLARAEPQAAQAESKPPEAQPPASRPERESRTAAEQPALPAGQELCSQIPQVQRGSWPPVAAQPQACWQREARESPQAAPHAPQARTQPLSAA